MSSKTLIVSVIPYFLEKDNFWIEKNAERILKSRKSQSFFEDNTVLLEKGLEMKLSGFLRKIDEMGYEKVLAVKEIGEFSKKGGVIDIFPVNMDCAIRIDFWGNQIESIQNLPTGIKNEKEAKTGLIKKLKRQRIYSQLGSLKPGDYLVHLDHGIGLYRKEATESGKKYYLLEYAQGDKLYVPEGLERKLSRYVGFVEPKIYRLSSPLWEKTKNKIKESAEKLAKELLEIYSKRELALRPPYLPDSEIDRALSAGFRYEETPDQIRAIEEIKNDMEKEKPMDRIVCGDVGFGKTEVALRAMVKAVGSGYQAALLCPTTILANQHFQNFRERLKNLPVEIAILSRLQTEKEQKEIIKKLSEGKIDILIGTHRILSNDVSPYLFSKKGGFGLLIIDDEQRFGVKQKEKLKKIRASLDILSLSATPIPRTLYLALSSLKAISLIQTPPEGRMAVKTFIFPFREKTIKQAIDREIERKGQVYFLYNRVQTIEAFKKILEKMSEKKWRISIAHGRLNEKELVETMDSFQNKKSDILLATTIIENGLDLPNVNTLIVADAAKLGLSQAYQLRGRIGRSHVQAFAYFLHNEKLQGLAKERLKALKEAEELGSGYRIAMKDLEIRGAGNILGKEQSGNVNQVGLNLYCQMISDAISRQSETNS